MSGTEDRSPAAPMAKDIPGSWPVSGWDGWTRSPVPRRTPRSGSSTVHLASSLPPVAVGGNHRILISKGFCIFTVFLIHKAVLQVYVHPKAPTVPMGLSPDTPHTLPVGRLGPRTGTLLTMSHSPKMLSPWVFVCVYRRQT